MNNFDTFNEPDEPAIRLEPETILAHRYRLVKQIGRGGMGVVWKAEEFKAGRQVVLKFVPHDLKNFESAVAQLKESFTKIHELQHQHICPVYTLEEDTTLGYYHVMKWLDGETLDEYVVRVAGRQKSLPMEDVLRILRPVAEALDYAHGNRIVHRDIKPSNIFIVLDEERKIRDVQVIDFGLASEIRSSMTRVSQKQFDTSGTRPYMAPEQWRGRPQSGSTDQYALGVMAYELLAGHLPFEGEDFQMLSNAVLNFPPEPIRDLSEHVNSALLKALAKDSSERFESCTEFVQLLGGAEFIATKMPTLRPAAKKAPQPAAPGVESLMKRGHLFLEDSDWKQANDYFDRVLDIDPEYAPAYIGKLCAELKVRNEEHLGDYEKSISEYGNFQKAVRFADDEYKTQVEGYDKKIRERIRQEQERREEQKRQEKERIRNEQERLRRERYDVLVQAMDIASTITDYYPQRNEYQRLAGKFREMGGYRNTTELANECDNIILKLCYQRLGEKIKTASTEEDYRELAKEFRAMKGYKNTAELADQCDDRARKIKERREEQERQEIYNQLVRLMNKASMEEDYLDLVVKFESMNGYKNTTVLAEECDKRYRVLKKHIKESQQENRKHIARLQMCISACNGFTVGLKTDGTVVVTGKNKCGQYDTRNWRDIVAISGNQHHVVGLKADGTVVVAGDVVYGQYHAKDWRDIAAVSSGRNHIVGLKTDGTVIAVGDNEDGQCDTQNWRGIVAISAGGGYTIGLKTDGTVIAIGNNKYGQCEIRNWKDIVAISAHTCHTVGLKTDGTVLAVGRNHDGECDTKEWKNIAAISTNDFHTAGLKTDGNVVVTGYDKAEANRRQRAIESWQDIIAISTG